MRKSLAIAVLLLDVDRLLNSLGELSVYLIIIAIVAVVIYLASRLGKKGEGKSS
jgi:hypothetical protein